MHIPKPQRIHRGKSLPSSYERIAILTVLADRPTDKSEIYNAVIADSIGAIVISKSSLYRLIKELVEKEFIEERGPFYLTDQGWRTLRQELARIENQRLILKQRLHL